MDRPTDALRNGLSSSSPAIWTPNAPHHHTNHHHHPAVASPSSSSISPLPTGDDELLTSLTSSSEGIPAFPIAQQQQERLGRTQQQQQLSSKNTTTTTNTNLHNHFTNTNTTSTSTTPTPPPTDLTNTPHHQHNTTASEQSHPHPPLSPITMAPASMQSQASTTPVAMRTGMSFGEAAALLSNGLHNHKSAQDTLSSGTPDVKSLIAAAGSAEAAIQNMLKEKQTAALRDTQLWRLVEKQRAMILNLNKDLERALKEKDRYKKKLKEHLDQAETAKKTAAATQQQQQQQASTTSSASASSKPASTPKPATAEAPIVPQITVVKEKDGKRISGMPSPLRFGGNKTPSPASKPADNPGAETDHHMYASVPETRILPATPEVSTTPMPTTTQADNNGTSSSSAATPTTSTRPTQQSSRKAPPAPLKLAERKVSNHSTTSSTAVESDSDVEGKTATQERGRRRTRAEDDRVRDDLVAEEDEARSRSKKSSQSQSQSKSDSQRAQPTPSTARPTVATQAVQPPVPSNAHEEPASIAAMISPPIQTQHASYARRPSALAPALMSPGLPVSPRPGNRRPSHVASPPMSPQSIASITNGPLSPRAPKTALPLPPTGPLAVTSPHLARAENYHQAMKSPSIKSPTVKSPPATTTQHPPRPTISVDTVDANTRPDTEGIFQGFVTSEHPDLLLPPNALPAINVKVFSSRMRPSRASIMNVQALQEDPVFTLAIYARSNRKQLWRIEKSASAIFSLDNNVKSTSRFSTSPPDKAMFTGHAPAKVDARRTALNQYFSALLDTPLDSQAALTVCRFFTEDAIPAQPGDEPLSSEAGLSPVVGTLTSPPGSMHKEGYLTKRGKNFGGWKARYFVLDGLHLRYFESPGGTHLGSIKLDKAQIGKQSEKTNPEPSSQEEDADNQFRHAFLILEPKKRDSSSLMRHVLCAENDDERDSWVNALIHAVSKSAREAQGSGGSSHAKRTKDSPQEPLRSPKMRSEKHENREPLRSPVKQEPDKFQAVSYNDTVAAEAPVMGHSDTPSPRLADNHPLPPPPRSPMQMPREMPAISAPVHATPISDSEAWHAKPAAASAPAPLAALPAQPAPKDQHKKRNFFGFKSRESKDVSHLHMQQPVQQYSEAPRAEQSVFGASLANAVYMSQPEGVAAALPSVVFRSIEYMMEKHAEREEGIFRLSGSSLVIKGLRERFNTERDVNLVDEPNYTDVHAVASLLKMYLRELPNSVLSRQLHGEFLHALDVDEKDERVEIVKELIKHLPRENLALLRALSQCLQLVVNNADINKMNLRNVGIVFAPTLNIPAPLISLFITEFDYLFDDVPRSTSVQSERRATDSRASSARPDSRADSRSSSRHAGREYTPSPSGQMRRPSEVGASQLHGRSTPPAMPTSSGNHLGVEKPNASFRNTMHHTGPPLGLASLNTTMGHGQMQANKARWRESSMMFMNSPNAAAQLSNLQTMDSPLAGQRKPSFSNFQN